MHLLNLLIGGAIDYGFWGFHAWDLADIGMRLGTAVDDNWIFAVLK